MIVHFTATAEQTLEAIGDRIAENDPYRALTFIRELRNACAGLIDFPSRFALVPRHEAAGIRHRIYGNYLIFYRIEAEQVSILAIVHGAMDYSDLLLGL